MKFFFYDAVLESGIPSSRAIDVDLAQALEEWAGLSNESGSFAGFYVASNRAVQFMYEDSEQVTLDITFPEQGGSFTSHVAMTNAVT